MTDQNQEQMLPNGPAEIEPLEGEYIDADAIPACQVNEDVADEQAIPMPTCLADLPEDKLPEYFQWLRNTVGQVYNSGDAIAQVLICRQDVEVFQAWWPQIIPQQLILAIEVAVREEEEPAMPLIKLQSSIESEWLVDYYNRRGLFAYIQAKKSPITPDLSSLKTLFLLEGLMALSGAEGPPQGIVRASGIIAPPTRH